MMHPKGTKAECHRDLKIDPKTIRKWWSDDVGQLIDLIGNDNPAMKQLLAYQKQLKGDKIQLRQVSDESRTMSQLWERGAENLDFTDKLCREQK